MSSSHQSTIMSLEQAKTNYQNMVTKYLMYFQISQIVSGKGSKCMYLEVRQSLSKGAAQIAPPPVVSILTEEYGI